MVMRYRLYSFYRACILFCIPQQGKQDQDLFIQYIIRMQNSYPVLANHPMTDTFQNRHTYLLRNSGTIFDFENLSLYVSLINPESW